MRPCIARGPTGRRARAQAIFYLANEQCGRDKRCEAHARDAHRLLLEKYGGDQPLLVLDLQNWEQPFRQVF